MEPSNQDNSSRRRCFLALPVDSIVSPGLRSPVFYSVHTTRRGSVELFRTSREQTRCPESPIGYGVNNCCRLFVQNQVRRTRGKENPVDAHACRIKAMIDHNTSRAKARATTLAEDTAKVSRSRQDSLVCPRHPMLERRCKRTRHQSELYCHRDSVVECA